MSPVRSLSRSYPTYGPSLHKEPMPASVSSVVPRQIFVHITRRALPLNILRNKQNEKILIKAVTQPSALADGHIFACVTLSLWTVEYVLAWLRPLTVGHCTSTHATLTQCVGCCLPQPAERAEYSRRLTAAAFFHTRLYQLHCFPFHALQCRRKPYPTEKQAFCRAVQINCQMRSRMQSAAALFNPSIRAILVLANGQVLHVRSKLKM